MLTERDAVRYLLAHELLGPEHVVAGDITVADISRRHHNYKITCDGPGYVLKQGVGPGGVAAVEREAAVYRLLAAGGDQLRAYLPRLHSFDPAEGALVLELIDGAQNLREYHVQHGYFPVTAARALAKVLGTLHGSTTPTNGQRGSRPRVGHRELPWVLSVHRPALGFLHECSSANLQLIQIIQGFPVFCELLDGLADDWRAESLIHGDVRWDNCIVFGKSPAARKTRMKLIDWELASMGDPCWDVASAFNDYLGFWLLSIPVTGELPPDRFLELARHPLEKMQPAIGAFWRTYEEHMELDPATADQWLERATRYSAARVVQTAFEQMQLSMQLTGNVVCMLQLSLNILQRPREASVQLLGIPLRGTWSR